MNTTVVLASQGQLGSLILRRLRSDGHRAVGVDQDICDLENPDSIRALFARFPGMTRLFNAAAFTAVDAAESQPRKTFRTNALGPGLLALCCASRGIGLVHFSTDYVFGSGHAEPIPEQAVPRPMSVYGRSKLLGEKLVLENHPGAFVLRSCGLYSAHRPNFVRTMVRLGLQRTSIEVVSDQQVTPTSADALAKVAVELADNASPGLYHATAQGECSWYQFAQAIFETLGMDVPLTPVDSSKWPAAAPRPEYSVLDNCLLRREGLDTFRSWRAELTGFLEAHGGLLLEEEARKLEGSSAGSIEVR